MIETLKLLNRLMEELNIPYTYANWDKDVPLPQFIGELSEIPTLDEDGQNQYDFTLTGYSMDYETLFAVSDVLKKMFKTSAIIEGTAVTYENTLVIDSGDEKLKQIEINMNIKDWRI